jgi:hypothetical protein
LRKGNEGGFNAKQQSDARLVISLCDELPPLENLASRTGSHTAHITVNKGMQISLHSSPFNQRQCHHNAELFVYVKKTFRDHQAILPSVCASKRKGLINKLLFFS